MPDVTNFSDLPPHAQVKSSPEQTNCLLNNTSPAIERPPLRQKDSTDAVPFFCVDTAGSSYSAAALRPNPSSQPLFAEARESRSHGADYTNLNIRPKDSLLDNVDESIVTASKSISSVSSSPLIDEKQGDLSLSPSSENNLVNQDAITEEFITTENCNLASSEHQTQDDELENYDICIPLPRFVNTIIRKKRKRVKSTQDAYKEAAKQIQMEKDSILNDHDYTKVKTWKPGMRRLLDIAKGDVGLALFIPFNWEAFESLEVQSTRHSLDESSDEDEMMIASDDEVESCPPILSHAQIQQIHSEGLPATVRLMTWTRCYSLQRDGDFFGTMFRTSSKYQHTLIVIKTATGDVLGGYADTPWKGHVNSSVGRGRSNSFFGGGKAFLYATHPAGGGTGDDEISFYRWTGENGYSQLCDIDKGALGMGGGGAFGFYVQDDFTIGSSGHCDTFGNPPLTKNNDGSFEIVEFEVYGFESMSERLFNARSRTPTFASVNSSVDSIRSAKSLTALLESRSLR